MKGLTIPFAEKILLGQIPLFQTLREKELEWVLEKMESRKLPRRSIIYKPDDRVDELYIIKKGCVKTESGFREKPFIKRLCFTGDIFGEHFFHGVEQRGEYAITLKQDTWVYVLKFEHLKFLIRRNSNLQFYIIQFLGNRVLETEKRVFAIHTEEATERVLTFLNEMVFQWGQKIGEEWLINHQLTQEEIGAYVGAGRQVVTDVLTRLKDQNIIHYSRGIITIRRLEKLVG